MAAHLLDRPYDPRGRVREAAGVRRVFGPVPRGHPAGRHHGRAHPVLPQAEPVLAEEGRRREEEHVASVGHGGHRLHPIMLERRNRRRLREAEAALEAPRGRHARVSYGDVSDEAEASLFKITDVDEIDWKTALKIGCFQVLAIIPGTSRSGATIIGGMLAGCSRTAAAEFTFFLAIPIMFGWGLVKCIKFVAAGIAMTSTEILVLAVGIITAFAMSVVAIKFLMGYIKKNDFTAFGWYRIVVGVLVLGYFVFESMGMLP